MAKQDFWGVEVTEVAVFSSPLLQLRLLLVMGARSQRSREVAGVAPQRAR